MTADHDPLTDDLLIGAYVALPGLMQSQNEDVRRYASAMSEIAQATIRSAIVVRLLTAAALLAALPYLLGVAVLVTHDGMSGAVLSGLPNCALLLGGLVGLPVLAFNRHAGVRIPATFALLAIAFLGATQLVISVQAGG
ncbi:hypothetical protein acdb102_16030 [Acidothermaceae bacterium B102]|nr:hypothetical protein acdb102_16030 [Acidothermaceae bacterium B102]